MQSIELNWLKSPHINVFGSNPSIHSVDDDSIAVQSTVKSVKTLTDGNLSLKFSVSYRPNQFPVKPLVVINRSVDVRDHPAATISTE